MMEQMPTKRGGEGKTTGYNNSNKVTRPTKDETVRARKQHPAYAL
jgi:hypothetical protein